MCRHITEHNVRCCVVARAPRIHRLCEIRDAENNMPAVNAIKALELIGDEQINRPNIPTPGISIRIVQVSSPPAPIDIKAAPRIIDASDTDWRELSGISLQIVSTSAQNHFRLY